MDNELLQPKDIKNQGLKFLIFARRNIRFFILTSILGLIGGLVFTSFRKIIYKSELVFVAIESEESGLNKLSSIGSQFGLDLGNGAGSAFSGDNLNQLFKSRYLIENTLFDSFNYNGENHQFLGYYLRRDSSEISKTPAIIRNIKINDPLLQFRQDSLIKTVRKRILKSGLRIVNVEKDLAFKRVEYFDIDPVFAKEFIIKLTENVSKYYLTTKLMQSNMSIRLLQKRSDSIENVLKRSMMVLAVKRDQNQFSTNNRSNMDMVKENIDVQLLTTLYSETIKNLELSKTMSLMSKPIIQIVDFPKYPLDDDSQDSFIHIVSGILLSNIIYILFVLIRKFGSNGDY
jgi:hypothetical protein